jgi:molybdopterin molybdotransferase
VTGEIAAGRHIRRTGETVPADAVLAEAGTPVTPALLGLAAGLGLDSLCVRPRPRVRAVVSGNEVVTSGPPGPGRVRDALGPALPGLIAGLGGDVVELTRVGDDPAELAGALTDPAGDVILTCGGSSVGTTDPLSDVLTGLGATVVVAGVACRPGHPQALAVLPDGRPVVGLPGNPYAALVALLTMLGPLCAGLAGRAMPVLPTARLDGWHRPADLTRIIAVRRIDGVTVAPTGHDRPASLWGAAVADALAVVPPGWAGEPVELLALPDR